MVLVRFRDILTYVGLGFVIAVELAAIGTLVYFIYRLFSGGYGFYV